MAISEADITAIVSKAMLVPAYGNTLKRMTDLCGTTSTVTSDIVMAASNNNGLDALQQKINLALLSDGQEGLAIPKSFELCTLGIATIVGTSIVNQMAAHPKYEGPKIGVAKSTA